MFRTSVAYLALLGLAGLVLLVFYQPKIPSETNKTSRESEERRRLQHIPKKSWLFESESLETDRGIIPTISCPLGMYRLVTGATYSRRPGGFREDGCIPCPRGRYGSTHDLTSSGCTDECPKGTYRDTPGAQSAADCFFCPEGTYGSSEGLVDKSCSGQCTDHNTVNTRYYSDVVGLTQSSDCKVCAEGYRGWQCEWEHEDRKNQATKNGFAGFGQDNAHQYINQGSDGSWSKEKYDGDWSGEWPSAGAIPENAGNYHGHPPDALVNPIANGVGSFDPAPRAGIAPVP